MSRIKECFITRFPEGVILEADFSQLEVIGLAALSMDPVLIEDLLAGRDMHRFFGAKLFGITEDEVTKAQRDLTKQLTFQLQYGSGAEGMAKKNGISKELAKEFIEYYYDRYERVKEWQDEVMADVSASRVPSGSTTPAGADMGKGEWLSPSGRKYVFFEKDGFRGEPSFNPPEVKNYPVQGFATGDLMALFRATVLRDLIEAGMLNEALPVNTVHDSVMFDCVNEDVAMELKTILEDAARIIPDQLEAIWGIHAPVPFKIETKIGKSWGSLTKVEK